MYTFFLNNQPVSTEKEGNLLEFLREQEGLTSVKNGCSEGTCGACMVLVDGKAMRACIVKIKTLEGKNVLTVEGLSQREKDVYAHCFAKAGAVQCGFCIPGMIISAKGLLDINLTPTLAEVKNAIKGNVCRCTGYKKIEEAILKAADMLRGNTPVPENTLAGKIGEKFPRIDAVEKALGTGLYTDDLRFPNMTYGGAKRLAVARAKIISINTQKAKEHPECIGIYTAEDIDGQRYIGHLSKDWPALIAVGEETRYVGDGVALACAKTKEGLREILDLVEVEYEELEPVTSPAAALQEGAAQIHKGGNLLKQEVLRRGDVEKAFAQAKHIVTHKYTTPMTEHAFLEPECAVAMPENDGVLVYTGGQSIYDEKREITELLGIPEEKVRVISAYVGGGFGGKEDMSVQHHAAFLAYKTKKTVKVLLTRKESIYIHPKRHAAEIEISTACDENGMLLAMKGTILTDAGAYASLSGPVLQRLCTHAAGPYNYQNIDIVGTTAYTNNPPGGAFRGFGVSQSVFASEANLNELAKLVGISPWEIRYRNAIRPGQVLPNGQIADESTALVETLEAVRDEFTHSKYAGIACAMKNAGLGVGVPDIGRTVIDIVDEKAHVRSSAACIGQGLATVLLQIAVETTGLDYNDIVVDAPDTAIAPDSGTTTASRQTVFTGESCKIAAAKLKDALAMGVTLKDLEGQSFYGEYFPTTDPMGSEKENPVSHVAYGFATQVVILDESGKVTKVIAAHDVGKAINPPALEGQIEGGVVMGLGYGLTEDFPLENGIPTKKFGTLGLFRAPQVPPIESIIVQKSTEDLAYGAKGVGEITTIPTAPACQGAYYAFDNVFRTKLPLENTFYKKAK